MNTPITDASRLELWTDPYTVSPQEDGDFVSFEISRRLELDRQTFRQALIDIYLSPAADSRGLANAALQSASKFEGETQEP